MEIDWAKTGDRMRQLRESAGLAKAHVEIDIGVARGTLAKYEAGNEIKAVSKLAALADLYGVYFDEMLIVKRTGK